ncbi:unnamed protein product, partial [Nesidiocoris tenuis]
MLPRESGTEGPKSRQGSPSLVCLRCPRGPLDSKGPPRRVSDMCPADPPTLGPKIYFRYKP